MTFHRLFLLKNLTGDHTEVLWLLGHQPFRDALHLGLVDLVLEHGYDALVVAVQAEFRIDFDREVPAFL